MNDHQQNGNFFIDPVEWGEVRQEIKNIVQDISGEQGIKKLLEKQNGRIENLESMRSKLIGGWLVTIFIVVPLVALLVKVL